MIHKRRIQSVHLFQRNTSTLCLLKGTGRLPVLKSVKWRSTKCRESDGLFSSYSIHSSWLLLALLIIRQSEFLSTQFFERRAVAKIWLCLTKQIVRISTLSLLFPISVSTLLSLHQEDDVNGELHKKIIQTIQMTTDFK